MVWAVVITERSGRDLSDYQVRVEVTDPDFFSECTEQRFVEFYDSDKTTLLPHYTELFDPANNKAVFWVKVPSIQANSTKTIYLNVNTARTEDLSDPDAVFDFFDDFEGSELDATKWDSKGDISVSDSVLTIQGDTANTKMYIKTKQTFSDSIKIIAKMKRTGSGDLDPAIWYWSDYDTWGNMNSWDSGAGGVCAELNESDDYAGIWLDASRKASIQAWTTTEWSKVLFIPKSGALRLKVNENEATSSDTHSYTDQNIYVKLNSSQGLALQIDYFAIAKYTDPEPLVTVAKAGATATLDFKRIVAKALAGKISHILNGDPRIKLYNGGTLIKEITAGAKLRKEDTANKRYIVMFLFVDDSNDAYTTDSQELVFPHDDGDYVAFTQSESFEKVSNEPLPLRWEIYVPWEVEDFGWG